MLRNKLLFLRDFLIKNSKIAFPVILTAAVAVTVAVALGASGSRKVEEITPDETGQSETAEEAQDAVGNVPLVKNEDEAIQTLITNYYNAQATGDLETLKALCDEISEKDLLLYQETSRYIDYYPTLEIYTKPGYAEGDTIAYVYFKMVFVNHEEEFPGYQTFYICTADDGSRYIMRSDVSEEANQYSMEVSEQSDVVEFMNHIVAEYDEFKAQYPDMAGYPEEVTAHVRVTVGELLSAQQAAAESAAAESQAASQAAEAGAQEGQGEPVAETGPQYATATTTVNVRSSDSEQADKLGKVSEGTRLEVVEVQVNGWTKLIYEGKEGFIKSEYLRMEESAAGAETVGTVKASTNINVRAAASETAEKLGVLAGGDTAELIALEGDWCKIKYNGQIAYVKAEYVEQQ